MVRVLEPKTAIFWGGLGRKKASGASAIPGHDKSSPGRKVTSNPPPPPSAYGAVEGGREEGKRDGNGGREKSHSGLDFNAMETDKALGDDPSEVYLALAIFSRG
jgi:hypothetical protein